MELSQSALAMLLLGGVPAGAAISLIYALTDFSHVDDSIWKRLWTHVKDFFFLVFAGLMAVLLVYYINQGEFRYLAFPGMLGGFLLTQITLARPVCRVRNAVLHVLSVPIIWLWSTSFGRLCARIRMNHQVKLTNKKGRMLEMLASNGF